jgi:hypothetical protein
MRLFGNGAGSGDLHAYDNLACTRYLPEVLIGPSKVDRLIKISATAKVMSFITRYNKRGRKCFGGSYGLPNISFTWFRGMATIRGKMGHMREQRRSPAP